MTPSMVGSGAVVCCWEAAVFKDPGSPLILRGAGCNLLDEAAPSEVPSGGGKPPGGANDGKGDGNWKRYNLSSRGAVVWRMKDVSHSNPKRLSGTDDLLDVRSGRKMLDDIFQFLFFFTLAKVECIGRIDCARCFENKGLVF